MNDEHAECKRERKRNMATMKVITGERLSKKETESARETHTYTHKEKEE